MSYRRKQSRPIPKQQTLLPPAKMSYSNPGTIRTLSTSQLTSGLPYQRTVKQQRVDEIIREWNDRKLTPVVVSFRDGKFNVVDGQNRIAAMRQMAGGGDVIVPCIIHTGMTYEEEADMYAKLDTDKAPLTLRQHTKALVEAGTDAKVTEVKRLVEEVGFTWALTEPTGEPFEIAPVRTLINAYRLLGGAAFSRMLALLAKTWRGAPGSTKAAILSGMALFVKTYETELNDSTFIKRLSAVTPEEIIRRGKIDFSTNQAALRFARVIWDRYNRQRGGRKLPYRFKG
ncbi:hypothetical protein D1159_11085 [Pseudoflavonifractor sp. 524-17]|uniref:DUF6551 family protein n=1 Tax=Pseudoflavonifractor sp. 524-17 TaxID=2304577 RepID=UPI001379FF94|nr:DUF6551 family protein [Pseudoflavonifractor sp. 524-17]NCE65103.1 hypothetical protein [Pseudoflavonifractor sp. 524-17]